LRCSSCFQRVGGFGKWHCSAVAFPSNLHIIQAGDLSVVTCGSVIKLSHIPSGSCVPATPVLLLCQHRRCLSGYRLHSHEVKYGSGSGQQSVTGSTPSSLFYSKLSLFVFQDSPPAMTATAIGLFRAATPAIARRARLYHLGCRCVMPPSIPHGHAFDLQLTFLPCLPDSSHARIHEAQLAQPPCH